MILGANAKSVRAVKPLDEEPFHKVTVQDISEGSPKVPGIQIEPRSSWMMPLPVQAMDPTKDKKSFAFERKWGAS
jgi:hypothetical protein